MFSVREATFGDYSTYARLCPELDPETPPAAPDLWSEEFAPRTLFLERDGDVVGYGLFNLYATIGYVVQLVVDPRVRREGVGRVLLGVLADRFRRAGCVSWALDVKVDNAPAIALYETVGLCPVRVSTSLRLDWAKVARLPREDRPMTSRVIDPAEDARIEAAFDLPRGQLAVLRTRRGRVQVRLVDPADPARLDEGFGVFEPRWPGAFPFRVARPTLAAALFDAVRPYAPPGSDIVHAVSEGDPELLQAFLDVGAEVRLSTLYMTGPLP